MKSEVRPDRWTQVDNWDKDLLVAKLTLYFRLTRYDDAKPAYTIQGKDTLNHWCDFAYASKICPAALRSNMIVRYINT